MIMRTWSARATEAGAADYRRYFETVLLDELRTLSGFAGGFLLSRPVEADVELTTHTLWASLDAIQAFAGADVTAAKVEPEAVAMLRDADARVVHRTVLIDARPA